MRFIEIISLGLIPLLGVSFAGCETNKEDNIPETTTAYNDSTTELDAGSEVIVGGWTKAEDGSITNEHREMFAKALQQWTGASYIPLELISTQVVAGINYKFLCEEISITAPSTDSENTIHTVEKYVTIYCDLQGECSILRVEDVGTVN